MTKIDIVYLWCDSTDENWLAKKAAYQNLDGQEKEATSVCRFVNNDELRYSLRSLAKFAPWINRIFLVTDHQIPGWLDANHPKVTLVNHEDILPADVLPIFNSSAIESAIHRIPGLAEHFLLANDDTFFGQPVTPKFFFNNGRPKLRLCTSDIGDESMYGALINNAITLMRRYYPIKEYVRPYHNIDAYRKSVYAEAYQMFPEEIALTESHRFRCRDDVLRLIVDLVEIYKYHLPIIYVQDDNGSICFQGNVVKKYFNRIRYLLFPRDAAYYVHMQPIDVKRFQKNPKPRVFCVNDDQWTNDTHRHNMRQMLETMFPDKSEFEK